MDTIVGYFEQYIEWVKESVRCICFLRDPAFKNMMELNSNNRKVMLIACFVISRYLC